MSTTTPTPHTAVHTHPVRGFMWGLMIGIGLAVALVVTRLITLDLILMVIITVIAAIAGMLWGQFGPAKAPTGPPPVRPAHVTPPTVSRFDDFNGSATAKDPRTLEPPTPG